MTLTKSDIVENLNNEIGLNKREAKELVDMLFNDIKNLLSEGHEVKLSGFGNFQLRDKSSRPGRNPRTGEDVEISARRVVTFKSGQNSYHKICANCHGADALGKQTRAPGLIDPEYLSENFSDEEMYKQIIEGSDKMRSQRSKVSDAEVAEIIKYLRYSQKAAGIIVEEDEPDDDDEE